MFSDGPEAGKVKIYTDDAHGNLASAESQTARYAIIGKTRTVFDHLDRVIEQTWLENSGSILTRSEFEADGEEDQ